MEAPTHALRADLAAALDARRAPLDEARSDAVARQHARGRWTARERLAAFCDGGSLVEYGRLVRPKSKRLDGVADGLVMGHATVDGLPVCVLSYDYTVHAGTQSPRNHHKIDRMLDLAEQHQWPVVIWSEGGGARPHELSYDGVIETFVTLARLSGLVPTVSIVPGRAFAGHANIAGLVDVTIGTRDACMGMAGPRLVEAATGESMTPEELGPMELHEKTGVIDLLVDDEEAAIRAARHYLSFFRGPTTAGTGPDVTKLRDVVPENPRRAYDVRDVIRHFADVESMLELRPRFAAAAVTALARIGGRPVGIVANQPMVLAGAIDAGAADKIARFISLCDAYDLPLVFLCDTPGFLVGHRVEQTGLVRHSVRTILALANATVPVLTVVLRKGYGLGYYAMGSDAFRPALLVAWPSAEFGGMGLEGAVDIMYGRELESTPDADRRVLRQAKIDELRAK
ncbi:MAG TPA: carboxyl transferase domain-containing protein, partial [Acidimicrobiales bacterium]